MCVMRSRSALALFVVSFLGVVARAQYLPAWFLSPPERADVVTVAYGGEHVEIDSALAALKRLAAVQFARQLGIRVSGSTMYIRTGEGLNWVGSDVRETVLSLEIAPPEKDLRIVSYRVMGTTYFGSVARGSGPDGPAVSSGGHSRRPDWVDRPPALKGRLTAVGQAPYGQSYFEAEAWRKAEFAALKQLALSRHAKVRSVTYKDDQTGQVGVQSEETDVTLKNWRVQARWKDTEQEFCYVLVSMPFPDVQDR
jgi:hypothetical protein